MTKAGSDQSADSVPATGPLRDHDALAALRDARIVGVLRAESAAAALALARPAIRAGLRAIEVTFTVPEASRVIGELARSYPDVISGAGTVLTAEQATTAIEAGAAFLVSPHHVAEVHAVARSSGVPYVPGGLTPSEVYNASQVVAGMVKVFPIARLGGSSYVRDLLGPYPALDLMVTGGVSLADAADYLAAGAKVVGIGSLFRLAETDLREALAKS